eukprot:g5155.t1
MTVRSSSKLENTFSDFASAQSELTHVAELRARVAETSAQNSFNSQLHAE